MKNQLGSASVTAMPFGMRESVGGWSFGVGERKPSTTLSGSRPKWPESIKRDDTGAPNTDRHSCPTTSPAAGAGKLAENAGAVADAATGHAHATGANAAAV